MWRVTLILCQFLCLSQCLAAQGDRIALYPQNCTLECIRQGDSRCDYCRISREDVKATLGIASAKPFGRQQTPEVCQHYVHAPRNVTVEFLTNENPKYETVTISWSPSQYGIAFLRGFQVSLQALGGVQIACQLFLLQSNLSLSASHAQRVYHSDPFPGLTLSTKYAVTVMALPVPERWDRFYHSKRFFTRSCPEKNGLEQCRKDWYPRYIEVRQEGHDIIVTFNLAPQNLGINHYFSSCYGGGQRTSSAIKPDYTKNRTHHRHRLLDLHIGTKYSCEIAADVVDAVRKTFYVQVQQEPPPSPTTGPSVALLIPVGVVLATTFAALLTVLCKKKLKNKMEKTEMKPDIIEQYYDKHLDGEQNVALISKPNPPRLLIYYSSNDGPAHVRAVMQLAAFLQRHMATQVFLDMWEVLGVMEEGALGWHCRKMKESDFVLVVCSQGLGQRPWEKEEEPEEERWEQSTSSAIVAMIGEELCRTKVMGQDLSKYMIAIFEYSMEADIPAVLGLASRYSLTRDLPLLFSHLHGVALQKPGAYLQVENISEEGYATLPAGAALRWAIQEARIEMSDHQFEERTGEELALT